MVETFLRHIPHNNYHRGKPPHTHMCEAGAGHFTTESRVLFFRRLRCVGVVVAEPETISSHILASALAHY